MRVAVASSADSLEAQMDPRFGRCAYFVVVDTDNMTFEVLENPGPQMGSGAGVAAAQLVADAGAEAVVAGNFGPNAAQALQAGGIRLFQAAGMSVGQAAQAAAAGQLPEATGPTGPAHAGMAGGVGMGMGPGMGGGAGGGRGMGGGTGPGGFNQQAQQPGGPFGPAPGPMGPRPGAWMPPMRGPMAG
ncbi:MAG: NifB/NifX family molybdenum-iron cluster-binding protein, partial [Armatimonadota bacterium]